MTSGHQHLTPALVQRAAILVRDRTGLVFPDARRPALHAGLSAAIARAGNPAPDRYLVRLGLEHALLDDLVSEITVGETYFFREPAQISFIRSEVIPDLQRRRDENHRFRIWSAGTATGEEAYSLAIVFRELGLLARTRVVGTDICQPSLARARRGLYGRWSLRGVSDETVGRYFTPRGRSFEIMPEIRSAVEFRFLNLVDERLTSVDPIEQRADLILCRNVLIYFDAETVAKVVRRLVRSLSDGGWLVVGGSDPPLTDLEGVEVVITDGGLAYHRVGQATILSARRLARRTLDTPAQALVPDAYAADASQQCALAVAPSPLTDTLPSEPERDAQACYEARQFDRAADLALSAVSLRPGDVTPWVLLVRALANAGRLTEAGRACAGAIDQHPTSAELAYLHAVLLNAAQHYAESATAARRALYLDRRLIVAHLVLGSALVKSDDHAGARRAFRNAEQLLRDKKDDELVIASDGERAGTLASLARAQLQLLSR